MSASPAVEARAALAALVHDLAEAMFLPVDDLRRRAVLAEKMRVLTLIERANGQEATA